MAHDAFFRVLARLEQCNVDFWHEQTENLHCSGQIQEEGERHRANGVVRREDEQRKEGQPDDTGRVVCEGEVAGLVEAVRTFACLERVHRTETWRKERRRIREIFIPS